MRQISEKQYAQFTSKERLNLTMAALSRGDHAEADRLWQTCPRHRYIAHDFEYTLSVNAVITLGMIFFEKCVWHYNLIKKAEMFIMHAEEDQEFEHREGHKELANQSRRLVELATKAENAHISKLKGLYEGFKQFCIAQGIDNGIMLKSVPVNDCCHDIDFLLASNIEANTQYAGQIKKFFSEHWHF